MGKLDTRVDRLERARPPWRCRECRGWPLYRVLYVDPLPELEYPAPACPERCERCGWEPLTIRVEYVDGEDWRAAS
jgi:hypothetical protein